MELREPATADSTSNTPTRTGCRGAPLPPPMELSVRMHVLTMVGNSVVISASATKVSGIEERRVSVLRAVWLSKFGPPCSSFGAPLWSFAFVVRCLPFFNTSRRPFKQNGGGRVSAVVLVVILCFCRYFAARVGCLLIFLRVNPPQAPAIRNKFRDLKSQRKLLCMAIGHSAGHASELKALRRGHVVLLLFCLWVCAVCLFLLVVCCFWNLPGSVVQKKSFEFEPTGCRKHEITVGSL